MAFRECLFREAVDFAGFDSGEAKFFAHRGDKSKRVLAVGANADLWIAHEVVSLRRDKLP